MLSITVLHGWLMVLLWTSDRNMSCNYTLAAFDVSFRRRRARYGGDVFYGSLFADVFPSLQTISRRSAQLVMDTPTRALTCRFLSDSWKKMICRARGCHGRSRVPLTLSLPPPSPRCRSPAGRTSPSTRRYLMCPSTPRRQEHPRLHISLSIPLIQSERHLHGKNVRIKDSAKLSFRFIIVYSEWHRDEKLVPLNVLDILCT